MKASLQAWLPEAPDSVLDRLAARRDTAAALCALLAHSPLYRRWLQQNADCLEWLCRHASPAGPPAGPGRMAVLWETFPAAEIEPFDRLRRFRRALSIRLAVREWMQAADPELLFREHSDLADFCLAWVVGATRATFQARLGMPWDEENGAPARLCVFALGKLGGRELNFFSDIDLLFCYEGDGQCRKEGRPTALHNRDFFQRMITAACRILQRRTPAGILYNVDLRLRPEGAAGPLVPSLAALVDYYFSRGQTWERLTLLKARRVCGSREMEHDFGEMIQSFRYPRHAPDYLPEEVAALKARTEAEVVGAAALARDIKNGYGGIREIEFFVQVMQLLHASRFPFLQTGTSTEALRRLARYNLVPADTALRLLEAYLFLRKLENRLQMADEKPVHALPKAAGDRAALVASMEFDSWDDLLAALQPRRDFIRATWSDLFPGRVRDTARAEWIAFFSGGRIPQVVRSQLELWFGDRSDEAAATLRLLATGDHRNPVTRDQLTQFLHLCRSFDSAFAGLADPVLTLARLNAFAGTYRARRQFLKACEAHPPLLRMLCLLFDRSTFIFQLISQHPGIMEELAAYAGRREKAVADHLPEMRLGPADGFAGWLWLYVKAEQVRISSNHLLGLSALEDTERQLSHLAEAACRIALERADPDHNCCLVALGKFGGDELTPGSDLDLLVLAEDGPNPANLACLRRFQDILSHVHPLGKTYEIDWRLRPHGRDGAPVIPLARLADYHRAQARFWEVQLLTRARAIGGNEALQAGFAAFRDALLFSGKPVPHGRWQELEDARRRMVAEKADRAVPARSFKSGPGGLVGIEFFAQRWMLAGGWADPGLRTPSTRAVLRSLARSGKLPAAAADALLGNYNRLREIEFCLRAEHNRNLAELPADPVACDRLARWVGCPSGTGLLDAVQSVMRENLAITASHLPPAADSLE